jgi:hypothetical protein
MPMFDQSIVINAPRSDVMDTLKRLLLPQDQVIHLREAPVVVVLREKYGLVYLLSGETGRTRVRLIVARADSVRDAFRGGNLRDALDMLAKTPSGGSATAEEGAAALEQLVQAVLVGANDTEPRAATIRERLTELIRLRGDR